MKQTSYYPISSEDIDWANHTKNQQHSENGNDAWLCVISEFLVAILCKKKQKKVWTDWTTRGGS